MTPAATAGAQAVATTVPLIAPAVTGGRIYVTVQGDWWDLIALKVFGMRRGDEYLMHKLIEANYTLRDIAQFSGGIVVVVPDIETRTTIALVPWKLTTVIPSTA
jgi:phage tail protein X